MVSLLNIILACGVTITMNTPVFCVANINADRMKRSDDVSLESLQVLVQQQATAIQTLQTQVAALNNMKTDVANLQSSVNTLTSKAKPVGFTARFSADHVDVGQHGILKLNHAVSNIGSAFNPQTGIFTAPLAGLYAFSLVRMAANDQPDASLAIDKHGTTLDVIWLNSGQDVHDYEGSSQVTTHLAAGEQLWVRHNGGTSIIRGAWWTIFTGFLVQAD